MARVTVDGETNGAFSDGFSCERRYLFNFFWGCLLFDGAFAHHVETGCAVTNQAGHIDHRTKSFDGIEVAPVGFPVPRQTRHDGVFRDVFNRFHHTG